MAENLQHNDQIDAYLMGKLEGEALQSFESAMASDKHLREEVDMRRVLLSGITTAGNRALKKRIAKMTSNNHFFWLAVIVLIAFLSALAFWFFPRNQMSGSTEDLYAIYYEPYEWSPGERDTRENQRIRQASQLYIDREYTSVIPILEQILETLDRDGLKLALANCLMNQDELEEAIVVLNDISNPLYLDHARWYSALANLKMGQPNVSLKILRELTNIRGSDHYQEARELIKLLE